jgi:WD40 repeat protein
MGGGLQVLAVVERAHEDAVTCLALNWRKGRLATGHADGSVNVWGVESDDGGGQRKGAEGGGEAGWRVLAGTEK